MPIELLKQIAEQLEVEVTKRQRSHDHHGRTKVDLRAIDRIFKLLCAITPEYFQAVRQFYEYFSQSTDEEVRELVARAAQRS